MKIRFNNPEAKGEVEILPTAYGFDVYINNIFQFTIDLYYNDPQTPGYKEIPQPIVKNEEGYIRIIPQNKLKQQRRTK